MTKKDREQMIEDIHKRGIFVFGNIHSYILWTDSRIIALGGRKPLDILEYGGVADFQAIEQSLNAIESGNFA